MTFCLHEVWVLIYPINDVAHSILICHFLWEHGSRHPCLHVFSVSMCLNWHVLVCMINSSSLGHCSWCFMQDQDQNVTISTNIAAHCMLISNFYSNVELGTAQYSHWIDTARCAVIGKNSVCVDMLAARNAVNRPKSVAILRIPITGRVPECNLCVSWKSRRLKNLDSHTDCILQMVFLCTQASAWIVSQASGAPVSMSRMLLMAFLTASNAIDEAGNCSMFPVTQGQKKVWSYS